MKQRTMRVEWYHWRFFGPGGSIRQLHQQNELLLHSRVRVHFLCEIVLKNVNKVDIGA